MTQNPKNLWLIFNNCSHKTDSMVQEAVRDGMSIAAPGIKYNPDLEDTYLDASLKQNLTLQTALIDVEMQNDIDDWVMDNLQKQLSGGGRNGKKNQEKQD